MVESESGEEDWTIGRKRREEGEEWKCGYCLRRQIFHTCKGPKVCSRKFRVFLTKKGNRDRREEERSKESVLQHIVPPRRATERITMHQKTSTGERKEKGRAKGGERHLREGQKHVPNNGEASIGSIRGLRIESHGSSVAGEIGEHSPQIS